MLHRFLQHKQYNFSNHHRAVADLCIITFFYLLQVGEYMTPSPTAQLRKQTISLRKCDIRMWCNGKILSPKASLTILLSADSASICIANTKNGTKNAVVYHEAIGGYLCPVKALAQRLYNIQQGSPTCPISTVFHLTKHPVRVFDQDITLAVQWGATMDGLLERGYTLARVS